eukprot:Lankesteria_metandrocarpae@DN10046_c0_g1_i1.p1
MWQSELLCHIKCFAVLCRLLYQHANSWLTPRSYKDLLQQHWRLQEGIPSCPRICTPIVLIDCTSGLGRVLTNDSRELLKAVIVILLTTVTPVGNNCHSI